MNRKSMFYKSISNKIKKGGKYFSAYSADGAEGGQVNILTTKGEVVAYMFNENGSESLYMFCLISEDEFLSYSKLLNGTNNIWHAECNQPFTAYALVYEKLYESTNVVTIETVVEDIIKAIVVLEEIGNAGV